MSGAVTAAAFVKPTKRGQWEADDRMVKDAALRDYCATLMGDAAKETATSIYQTAQSIVQKINYAIGPSPTKETE